MRCAEIRLPRRRKMASKTRLLAIAAAVFLGHMLSACQTESQEPSAAQRALDELQRKYDELIEDKVDVPVKWATADLENIGDWEYRVENLSYTSPEDLADQLNEFGNDKWEVIWLERTHEGYLAVLKKPAVSYLSKIPLSQLGKIVIGGPDGQD